MVLRDLMDSILIKFLLNKYIAKVYNELIGPQKCVDIKFAEKAKMPNTTNITSYNAIRLVIIASLLEHSVIYANNGI